MGRWTTRTERAAEQEEEGEMEEVEEEGVVDRCSRNMEHAARDLRTLTEGIAAWRSRFAMLCLEA